MASIATTGLARWPHRRVLLAVLVVSLVLNVCFVAGVAWTLMHPPPAGSLETILQRMPADLALVSVLAYRAIAIWLPAPIGLVALGALRRTMARWSAEDAVTEVQAQDVAPAGAVRAPVPVARAPRPCAEPALLAA